MEKLAIKIKNKKILFGLLFLHLFLLFNLKFTDWPEMLLWPYLIIKGWLPYQDIAIAHTPLVLIDLSIFYKLFGIGVTQLKIYTWLTILLIDLTIFLIVKRFWSYKEALLSLLFYIPIQIFYEGNGLWFDLTLALFALLTFFSLKEKNWKLAGILWMLAFFVKQTAVWLLPPILLMLFQGNLKKSVKDYLKGTLLVLFGVIVLLSIFGIFDDFIFWAIRFGTGMLPKSQGQVSLPTLKQFSIAYLPFLLVIITIFKKNRDLFLLAVWSIFATLGTFPRWGLFHFQPALPFLSILGALSFYKLDKADILRKVVFISFAGLILILFSKALISDWKEPARFQDDSTINLVNFISNNTHKEDKIYALNAWDSVYALSNTLPAAQPWIPHLSWYMELEGIQENIIKDISYSKPKMIIIGKFSEVGLSSYKPDKIVEYIQENYVSEESVDNYNIFYPKE